MSASENPWYAKLLAACVVTYAFSPVDLVPDFIPVLGHLDDLLLIPLGVALVLKVVPNDVITECRAEARSSARRSRPVGPEPPQSLSSGFSSRG